MRKLRERETSGIEQLETRIFMAGNSFTQSGVNLFAVYSVDGSGNNASNPTWGQAGADLYRGILAAVYGEELGQYQIQLVTSVGGKQVTVNSSTISIARGDQAFNNVNFVWSSTSGWQYWGDTQYSGWDGGGQYSGWDRAWWPDNPGGWGW